MTRLCLVLCLLAACSKSAAHAPDGGSDGDGGTPPGGGVCMPACSDEPHADVACTVFASCESTCKTGFARCSEACVAETPAQCGAGCQTCPASAHGAATCSDGVCGLACAAGFAPCRNGLALDCCAFASEVIAPQTLGGVEPSIAVDAGGALHVAYFGLSENQLLYATDRSGAWQREAARLYWSDGGGAQFQIAPGASGPEILYSYPNSSGALWFAERRSTGWSHLPLTDDLPAGFAMVTDRAGRAHACLTRSASHPGVRYAIRRGDRWTITQVTDDAEALAACAIAVDASGLPHIAYFKTSAQDVAYAHGDAAGQFSVTAVDTAGAVGSELSIAIGPDGAPHIAAYRADAPSLRHAQLQGGTWTVEDVGVGRNARRPAIAIDHAGVPVIAYFDQSRGRVAVTERPGGTWIDHVFDDVTRGSGAIAVAPDGAVYIATGDRDGEPDVVVHVRTATGWDDRPVVDAADQTGRDASLLHRAGEPVLVYTATHDGASQVEIATRTAGAWSYAQLPGPGAAATAALDAAGALHVAYNAGADLTYAVQSGASFALEPIASMAGAASLALDAAGTPHVVYVTSAGALVHAVRGGAGWTATPIASGGSYQQPVLRIGPGDVVHVLWYDGVARQTIYASSADGFTSVIVEPTAATGHDLVVTADGVPHACFLRRTASGFPDLRVGARVAGTWSNALVSPPGTSTNDDVCAIGSAATGAIAIARSLRHGAGIGELWITTLGPPDVHTAVLDDFYSGGLGISVGAGGFEISSTGVPYAGSGLDQPRLRWSHH